MEITILNWDRYNPKRAQKSYTWLRLNNDVFQDPKLHGLSLEGKAVWIFLLCMASRENSGLLRHVTPEWLAQMLGTKAKTALDSLNSLQSTGLISIDALSLPPVLQNTTPTDVRDGRTNERTDGRTYVQTGSPVLHPLAALWNENCGGLPKCIKTSGDRRRKAEARWKEHSPEEWVEIVKRIATSKFCTGHTSGSNWVATFDWILKPDTATKVLEGKYDNRGGAEKGKTAARIEFEKIARGEA